jgi:hypothetical protein
MLGEARPRHTNRGLSERTIVRMAGSDVAPDTLETSAAAQRPPAPVRRWSGLPIATSLALVAFSVVFGVYGPRVVDRGSPSVGTPLWEAVDAAAEYLDQYIFHAPFREDERVAMGEATAELAQILHQPVVCPDLSDHDFLPFKPRRIRVPGAPHAAVVVFARSASGGTEYLSLVIAPYNEQYTLFSEFGRPHFLVPGGAIGVDAAPSDRIASSSLAWTNGTLLFVAIGSKRTTLGDVAPDLAPAMAAPE